MEDDFDRYYSIIAEKWFEIGNRLYEEGKINQAVRAYREGLKMEPRNPGILFNLACTYEETGDFETALSLLDRFLEQVDDRFGLYKRAVILKQLDRDEGARAAFAFAESIDAGGSEEYIVRERKKAMGLLGIRK